MVMDAQEGLMLPHVWEPSLTWVHGLLLQTVTGGTQEGLGLLHQ